MTRSISTTYITSAQYLYHQLKSLWYSGNTYICSCCERTFRKFLPFGVGGKPRPNAQCPGCGSLERHRLLWLYLKDKNFFESRLKILDIAPMKLFQKKCISLPNLDYTSADISSPLAMVQMDITDIKLPDNQFDCIMCYHVLEHILDDQKAMHELYRVLKPGGWAILQSPVDFAREKTFEDPSITSPQDRLHVFGHEGHVRIYGRDYKDRLEQAGFTVKLDNYVACLDDATVKKYGLMKDENLYFCSKSEF